MSNFRKLDDLGDIRGKVALVRVDLNLPMQDGAVTDDTRVQAAKSTILELADKGAFELITRTINGGLNGEADRLAIYERAEKVLAC